MTKTRELLTSLGYTQTTTTTEEKTMNYDSAITPEFIALAANAGVGADALTWLRAKPRTWRQLVTQRPRWAAWAAKTHREERPWQPEWVTDANRNVLCLDCEDCAGCVGCVGCKACKACEDCQDCVDCEACEDLRGLRWIARTVRKRDYIVNELMEYE